MMQAKQLVDGLLSESEQAWILCGEGPEEASPAIHGPVRMAARRPGFDFDSAVAGEFRWAVERQRSYEPRRQAVLQLMSASMPSPAEHTTGMLAFPAWVEAWWVQVVQAPWSARMIEAVEEAELVLNGARE